MADARSGEFRLAMGRLPPSAGGPPRRSPGPGRPGWPTPWPEVDRAVARLLDGVAEAVGGDLVGLYLGGSLGLGDVDPASSDVDVLVATARALPAAAVDGLRRLHGALHAEGGWAARLEVGYLPLATLRRFDPEDTARYPFRASDREFALGGQARPGCWTAGWSASTGWWWPAPTRGS